MESSPTSFRPFGRSPARAARWGSQLCTSGVTLLSRIIRLRRSRASDFSLCVLFLRFFTAFRFLVAAARSAPKVPAMRAQSLASVTIVALMPSM